MNQATRYKKVLFVSYHFPPVGGGGVQRPAKFVKYLPHFGWLPYVLTVQEPYDFYQDTSLLSDIPDFIKIYRSRSVEPMKWVRKRLKKSWGMLLRDEGAVSASIRKSLKPGFLVRLKPYLFFPDNEILWLPFGIWKGLQVIRKEKPQAIFSTASPYTAHLIALVLSRWSGLPWVADFRDFWVDRANFPRNRWRLLIDRRMERWVLKWASHVTTVSQPIAQRFRTLQPQQSFTTISNGYDETDFTDHQNIHPHSDSFTITYTGIFNKEQNPQKFFAAVKSLLQKRKDFRERVRLKLIGQMDNPGDFDNYLKLKAFGLTPYSEISTYQPHYQVVKEMQQASVLFLLIGEYPYSEAILTGKLFEYLRARRPILAVVPPEGVAAEIIRRCNAGIIVPNNRVDAIERGISYLFDAYLRGNLEQRFKWQNIDQYERRNLTGKLAEILNNISMRTLNRNSGKTT